ncbi:putative disulfide bond formation protein B [Actinobacillus pleuropneumoniae]|nr:putative disulfide bond formation protein B [Actinobacillus pleuropneumoniae]KIE99634.1 putative disulfide bond formation protein B [Actinobacillus pleuropneumoniae]
MLSYFKELSLNRTAWLLLAFVAFALEASAIYFQYGMGLVPCVMCVYERLAIFGLLIAGLVGAISPRFFLTRWLALLLWGFSAFKGLALAIKHHDYQANPSPWNQCEFKPEFPQTMPFDQCSQASLPRVRSIAAKNNGKCSDLVCRNGLSSHFLFLLLCSLSYCLVNLNEQNLSTVAYSDNLTSGRIFAKFC